MSRIATHASIEAARAATHAHLSAVDAKPAAAVAFALRVARERGHVSDSDISAVREAGYDDRQVVEIVLHVALNSFTNYLNGVAQTAIDFPVVDAAIAA